MAINSFSVGKYVFIDEKTVLNTDTGEFLPPTPELINAARLSAITEGAIVPTQTELQFVMGLSRQVINLNLKSSEGLAPSVSGFLIEVYESGSDGRLTRAYREDVVDLESDSTLSRGFSQYLVLDVDVGT